MVDHIGEDQVDERIRRLRIHDEYSLKTGRGRSQRKDYST